MHTSSYDFLQSDFEFEMLRAPPSWLVQTRSSTEPRIGDIRHTARLEHGPNIKHSAVPPDRSRISSDQPDPLLGRG